MAKSSSLKNKLISLLFYAAQLRLAQPLVSFFFKIMGHILPVDRLLENNHWVAFHHPQPNYPLHILILPKQGLRSLMDAPDDDPMLYSDLFALVQELIVEFQLDKYDYRLITNGGENQTIPQWHWHLISDHIGDSHA